LKIQDARLLTSAAAPSGFPREGVAEIAFLGRSNVGKSSLLNALVGRRGLARTSATPGKTRLAHFFLVERDTTARDRRRVVFVDLPGYGWAKVARTERAAWQKLVESYLDGRVPLRLAILLHDLRRDPGDEELDLLAWLAERDVPALVAITKSDKLAPMRRAERVKQLAVEYGVAPSMIVATSAQKKDGIDAVWRAIDARLAGTVSRTDGE
jgi:GTP-binding protein